jgi:hypothetical protein
MKAHNMTLLCWLCSIALFLGVISFFWYRHNGLTSGGLGFYLAVIIFSSGAIFLAVMGIQGTVWQIRVEGEKIRHRNTFGKVREYTFSDITKVVVSGQHEDWRIYSGTKRIFTIGALMRDNQFSKKIYELNIPQETTNNMTIDHHVIRPHKVLRFGSIAGFCFCVIAVNGSIQQGAMTGIRSTIVIMALFLYEAFILAFEKTEVEDTKIIQHNLLKKTVEIELDQIKNVIEKSSLGNPYFVMYDNKQQKLMKVRKSSDSIMLFQMKMFKEGKMKELEKIIKKEEEMEQKKYLESRKKKKRKRR